MAIVEIYALKDPRDGVIRYIGKANDSAKRFKSHMRDSARRNTPVYKWIRELISLGLKPEIEVIERVSKDSWPEKEKSHIAKIGLDNLLNVAIGGNQPFCDLDTHIRNGKRNARLVHDNPLRKKIWALKRSIGQDLKDGYVREDTKEKLRRAARMAPHLFGEYASI